MHKHLSAAPDYTMDLDQTLEAFLMNDEDFPTRSNIALRAAAMFSKEQVVIRLCRNST
jgi:hypothetical protein